MSRPRREGGSGIGWGFWHFLIFFYPGDVYHSQIIVGCPTPHPPSGLTLMYIIATGWNYFVKFKLNFHGHKLRLINLKHFKWKPCEQVGEETIWLFTTGYITTVLEDATVYSKHAGKKELDADDVQLAIQSRLDHSYTNPPPREVSCFDIYRYLFLTLSKLYTCVNKGHINNDC